MDDARHVRLFKNGRSQAVRIPKDMEFPGDEALIYREGTRLVIEPMARPSLTRLLAGWEPIDVAWPDLEDRPPEPVDLTVP